MQADKPNKLSDLNARMQRQPPSQMQLEWMSACNIKDWTHQIFIKYLLYSNTRNWLEKCI